HAASVPTALYGIVLLMAAIAYTILQVTILAHHHADSRVAAAFGRNVKGKVSLACYAAGVAIAMVVPLAAVLLYVVVALVVLIPHRGVEAVVAAHATAPKG